MKDNITAYDAVIIGGGISGVSCAYNCARLNLKTLLIEKENYLGGNITGALVVPVMKSDASSVNNIFYNNLIECAKKFGAQNTYCDNNEGWFNPVILKSVLETMLREKNVDILYETTVVDAKSYKKNIVSIETCYKTLSLPIVSKYYVDATGDASFSKILNCELWNDSEKKQPASLRFIMSNVDLKILANFLEETDSDKNITTTYRNDSFIHLSTAFTWDTNKRWALAPYFERALQDKVLQESDLAYFQIFTVSNMPGSVAFNCPRLRDYNCNDPFDYSEALIEAREAILRLSCFVKRYIPGFKDAYISNIASQTGYREINRVKCLYDYTIEDIISQKIFPNPAVHSNYPVDIHSNTKDASVLYEVRSYMLPTDSLIAKDYDNLYAIGKIAGTDFNAHGALRVQSSCMSMGEAAALDIKSKIQ